MTGTTTFDKDLQCVQKNSISSDTKNCLFY